MAYIIGGIIWGIIWGFATNAVIQNKGYYDNWFWWGFFFGFIAFIVALTKPENRGGYSSAPHSYSYSDNMDYLRGNNGIGEKRNDGSWTCKKCRAVNPSYTGTCKCGNTKNANERNVNRTASVATLNKSQVAEQPKAPVMSENERVDALLKYKNLLDMGAITEEEFVKKKNELLDGKVEGTESSTNNSTESFDSHTPAQKVVINLLEKNPNGITAMKISQLIPRSISPKEISDALRQLVDSGEILKDEAGFYKLK